MSLPQFSQNILKKNVCVDLNIAYRDRYFRLYFFINDLVNLFFLQEYMRQSEQQLNELDKHGQEKKPSSKVGSQSRSHSSPSMESNRFDAANAVNTPCYVPGGDILPILVRSEHSVSPSNGDAYNTNIYTVGERLPPSRNTRHKYYVQGSSLTFWNRQIGYYDEPSRNRIYFYDIQPLFSR